MYYSIMAQKEYKDLTEFFDEHKTTPEGQKLIRTEYLRIRGRMFKSTGAEREEFIKTLGEFKTLMRNNNIIRSGRPLGAINKIPQNDLKLKRQLDLIGYDLKEDPMRLLKFYCYYMDLIPEKVLPSLGEWRANMQQAGNSLAWWKSQAKKLHCSVEQLLILSGFFVDDTKIEAYHNDTHY